MARVSDLNTDHPFAETEAARSLAIGLRRASVEEGLSLRKLAAVLGIKQATVLSHMAHGRIAIPLDRAMQLAEALKLDARSFCLAVLEQRSPDIAEELSEQIGDRTVRRLTEILGGASLDADRLNLLAEIVRDSNPFERWLRTSEIAVVNEIRRLRPDGFSELDRDVILGALSHKVNTPTTG